MDEKPLAETALERTAEDNLVKPATESQHTKPIAMEDPEDAKAREEIARLNGQVLSVHLQARVTMR